MTLSEPRTPPAGDCPICGAHDAFVDLHLQRQEYFVECLNCGVYIATRKAFRHFEYLRGRADRESLEKLQRLAAVLKARERGPGIRLEYETWHQLVDDPAGL